MALLSAALTSVLTVALPENHPGLPSAPEHAFPEWAFVPSVRVAPMLTDPPSSPMRAP